MIVTGPFPVVLGKPVTFPPPEITAPYFASVVISNASPYIGIVSIGSDQFLLPPFTADVYVPPFGIPITMMPTQAPGVVVPAGVASYAGAEWSYSKIESGYPLPLVSQGSPSVIITTPEDLLATVPGGTASVTVTDIPVGTQSLVVLALGTTEGAPSAVGDVTGATYVARTVVFGVPRWSMEGDFELDTSATVSWGTAPTETWYVFASTATTNINVTLDSQFFPAQDIPAMGLTVGGVDSGGKGRVLLTDTAGKLEVNAGASAPASGATAQVTVTDVATEIVAANANRTQLTLINTSTVVVYIGGPGVTTGNGFPLLGGYPVALAATQAWYGIVTSAAGSAVVGYEDE